MSSEKKIYFTLLRSGLKAGATGFLLILTFLMFGAFLISKEYVPYTWDKMIIFLASFVSGFSVIKLLSDNREEGALAKGAVSTVLLILFLFLSSLFFKDIKPDIIGILRCGGLFFAGYLLAATVKLGKKNKRKHYQRRKYYK